MWEVASKVLQGVVSHVLEKPNTNQVPYRPSTPTTFIPNQHSAIAIRSDPTNRAHVTTSTCVNCSSNVSRPSKTPERDYSHTKGKNSRRCLVVVPDSGNFDIRIRKTETQFANLSVQSSKGSQQKRQYEQVGHPKNRQQNAGLKIQNGQKNNYATPNVGKHNFGDRNNLSVQSSKGSQQKRQYEQVRHPKNRQQNAGLKIQNGQKNNHATPNVGKHNFGDRNNDNNMHGILKTRRANLSHNTSTWMYLGRLKVGTTEADIKTLLTEMFPGRQFKVELLPLYKDGKLSCFKVLVDNAILEEFQNLNPWPVGVKITKYIHNFKS